MDRALREFSIGGVKSTIALCRFVLAQKEFVDGNINTRFLETHLASSSFDTDQADEMLAAAVSAFLICTGDASRLEDRRTHVDDSGSKWRASRSEAYR
jgi:pyruvate carboxylase